MAETLVSRGRRWLRHRIARARPCCVVLSFHNTVALHSLHRGAALLHATWHTTHSTPTPQPQCTTLQRSTPHVATKLATFARQCTTRQAQSSTSQRLQAAVRVPLRLDPHLRRDLQHADTAGAASAYK